MKQTLTLLITFCLSLSGLAQCEDLDKLELGGTYSARTRNYIPFEIKYEGKIEKEDIFYPFNIQNIEEYSDFILLKAKEYIVNRANINFYNKLEMGEFQVNYPKSVHVEYDNYKLYNLRRYKVTYWILFTYQNNGFSYAFGLEFDKEGKMISEHKFPEFSLNSEFEKLIEPCSALNQVKSDKRFENKKVDAIELAYVDKINAFCWLVKEKLDQPMKLGINEYSLDSFYVNANTNVLEFIEKRDGRFVACGGPKMTIVKKKH